MAFKPPRALAVRINGKEDVFYNPDLHDSARRIGRRLERQKIDQCILFSLAVLLFVIGGVVLISRSSNPLGELVLFVLMLAIAILGFRALLRDLFEEFRALQMREYSELLTREIRYETSEDYLNWVRNERAREFLTSVCFAKNSRIPYRA
ncbi:MAG TPA: hypothetical protein VFQ60_01660 [Patescibacteria group bacterium]|nr:hypothetical protein [Patescibacteria group bacterium]